MIDGILGWIVTVILNWAKQQALNEAAALKDAHDADVQRGETNSANVQKYQAAKIRAEKIADAVSLLNRTSS